MRTSISARRLHPGDRPCCLARSLLAVALGSLLLAATQAGNDPVPGLRHALELLASGDEAGAEQLLVELLQRYPDSWRVALHLGRLRVHKRRAQEALAPLERAARLAPRVFETRSTLGQALALEERLPEAEREFRAALALRPADFLSHFNLGRIYRLQERYEEALEQFQQALEHGANPPQLSRAHQNLGMVLQALSRPSEAIPHLQEYLKLRPDGHETRLQLAILQFDVAQYDGALEAVELFLKTQPTHPKALYLHGMLCKIKGRNDQAIESFRAAVSARPDYTRARYQLATILFEEARYTEAEPILRRVVETVPEHPNAHYVLSSVLRRLGRDQEAEAELAIHNRITEEQRSKGRTAVAGND